MPDVPTIKLPRQTHPIAGTALTTTVIAVSTVAALYFARDVLVPVALALLLSFVLAPPVRLLQSWYVPRVVAVFVVVAVAFSAIFALGALMVSQVNQLATDLPSYQSTLREKIRSVRGAAASASTLERASEVLQDLSREIDRPKSALPTAPGQQAKPIPVEVRQPDPGALQMLAALIAPLIHPLTATGLVVIFVVFILMQRQDLRNRLVRLAGAHDLQRTTAALDDAGQRLSRLFLTQLMLNAAFGLVIGVGLWLIGVPRAPLWGMLAMILRFVPYIGAIISAILPIILAAAVGSGWTMVVMTAALFLVVEPIVGHVIEPLVYGHSSGLSPVAVVASATFWTWLWGPIGLVLATPLTLCLVVAGRHVERLKFLHVMFGDEPPLTPAEVIYQRMLASDPIEAGEQARKFLKERPLAAYYDEILLPGLKLAQADAERGLLDEERLERIRDTVAEVVDDLSTHRDNGEVEDKDETEDEDESPLARLREVEVEDEEKPLPPQWRSGKPVLCLPGPSLLDEAAATVLAQLLEKKGIGARSEEAGALSMSRIFALELDDVALICLCYVEHATPAQIHYAIRRVRRRAPDVDLLVVLFGNAEMLESEDASRGIYFAYRFLREAVDKVQAIASQESATQPSPALAGDAHMAK
jgi:predicted PurR-regulated permease PerM